MRVFTFKLVKEIINNKYYFLLSLLISMYIFIPYFLLIQSLEYGIGVLISVVILFIFSKINKLFFLLFSIISLFLSTIILHIIMHWGTNTLVSRIEVASLSPKSESIEYLATYVDKIDILVVMYFIFGGLLIYRFFSKYTHSYKLIKTLSMALLFIIFFALISMNKINKIIPYFYVDKYINVIDMKKLEKRKEYLTGYTKKSNMSLKYDKIIIIVGESVNKEHMSLYGYSNNTTPFLNSLVNNQNTFKYNVIAPTNQTRYSIPINLTDANVSNFNVFFTSKSIVTTFKEYGYKTYWLSNQGSIGLNENYIASIANEADVIKMANVVYSDAKDDNILIKYLNNININIEEKEAYFFHIMGSHASYSKRYSRDDALFKNPKNIIDEYDNTIYHTDKILDKIYNKFKNTRLLFIYLSDHGEVVNIEKNGHGYSPAYKDEYDIPLVVCSSIYNKKLFKLKKENKNFLLNMESFNNIVEYIVGIDVDFPKISHSPKVFTLEPTNIVDYNKLKSFE